MPKGDIAEATSGTFAGQEVSRHAESRQGAHNIKIYIFSHHKVNAGALLGTTAVSSSHSGKVTFTVLLVTDGTIAVVRPVLIEFDDISRASNKAKATMVIGGKQKPLVGKLAVALLNLGNRARREDAQALLNQVLVLSFSSKLPLEVFIISRPTKGRGTMNGCKSEEERLDEHGKPSGCTNNETMIRKKVLL